MIIVLLSIVVGVFAWLFIPKRKPAQSNVIPLKSVTDGESLAGTFASGVQEKSKVLVQEFQRRQEEKFRDDVVSEFRDLLPEPSADSSNAKRRSQS